MPPHLRAPRSLTTRTLLHGGPAGVSGVAVLWEALGTAEMAQIGVVGVVPVEGAWRRGGFIRPHGHIAASVNLTLGKHQAAGS